MRHGSTFALWALLGGAASLGWADEAGLPTSRLGQRAAPMLLLTRPDVRADLGLSPEQADAADRAIQDLYRRAEAVRGQADTPQAAAARKAIDVAGRDWITGHLSKEQAGRLLQIDLQWEGPAALVTRATVAEALGLTTEQGQSLRAALEETRRPGPAAAEAQRRLGETALALLTADQRERWKAMLGRPFAVQMAAGERPRH